MINALEILGTLGKHLDHPVELTLYGRAALALGFKNHLPDHETTKDVDAIIPLEQLESLQHDFQFWDAIDKTNDELQSRNLYITHTFSEADVIIQPDWMSRRVGIQYQFPSLTLYRPATHDFILTKMMRDDREDLADIQFLLAQEPIGGEKLKAAFHRARVPDIAELHEIFQRMQPKVLQLLSKAQ